MGSARLCGSCRRSLEKKKRRVAATKCSRAAPDVGLWPFSDEPLDVGDV